MIINFGNRRDYHARSERRLTRSDRVTSVIIILVIIPNNYHHYFNLLEFWQSPERHHVLSNSMYNPDIRKNVYNYVEVDADSNILNNVLVS